MQHSIISGLVAGALLPAACHKESRKLEFYHFPTTLGYCIEVVDEAMDEKDMPKVLVRGACPLEVTLHGSTKAYRYASCPEKGTEGGPMTFVIYSRMVAGQGTDDMTGKSPADTCKELI